MSLYEFQKYALESKEITSKRLKGSNQKALLVVLKTDEKSLIPFLQKILQAIKMDWEKDILVLEIDSNTNLKLSEIWDSHKINQVLVFGIPPKQLGLNINIKAYEPLNWTNRQLLFSHDLTYLNDPKHAAYKKTLWNALKSLFLGK